MIVTGNGKQHDFLVGPLLRGVDWLRTPDTRIDVRPAVGNVPDDGKATLAPCTLPSINPSIHPPVFPALPAHHPSIQPSRGLTGR